MMPPPSINNYNKNRVENIKKKFEDINKFVAVNDNLNHCRPNPTPRGRLEKSEIPGNGESKTKTDSPKKQKVASDLEVRASTKVHNNPSKALLERQLSSPTSRGHIKRSQAFRCDRIVKGQNVLSSASSSPSGYRRTNVDKRVKELDANTERDAPHLKPSKVNGSPGTNGNDSSAVQKFAANSFAQKNTADDNRRPKEFAQSLVETKENNNLTPRGTNEKGQTGGWLYKRHESNKIGETIDSNTNKNKKTSPQSAYFKDLSEVKLKNVSKDAKDGSPSPKSLSVDQQNTTRRSILYSANASDTKNGVYPLSNLSPGKSHDTPICYQPGLTNTLKAALKAPLPRGPPPKKPPRTFAHTSTPGKDESQSVMTKSFASGLSHDHNPIVKPIRSKTESQIMLQKLENALLNHKTSVHRTQESSPTLEREKSGNVNSIRSSISPEKTSSQIYHGKDHLSQSEKKQFEGHFSIANRAINQENSQNQLYNQAAQKHDAKTDGERNLGSSPRMKPNGLLHKSQSVEHIYAEPFQYIGSETPIRNFKDSPTNFKIPITLDNRNLNFHPKGLVSSHGRTTNSPITGLIEANTDGLHYLCTPIQENSGVPLSELYMTSLPSSIGHSSFAVDSSNADFDKWQNHSRSPSFASTSKQSFKRSPGEKNKLEKSAKISSSGNLNSTKVKFLMNQAFGSPLQCPLATPLDSNSDSDSLASTPEESVPTTGTQDPTRPRRTRKMSRPSDPPPDAPGAVANPKESMKQLTDERRIYVRRVSSYVSGQRPTRLRRPSSTTCLFECLLLVGLNLDPDRNCKVAYIKSKFPPEVEVPAHIEDLCFPDAATWPPPVCASSNCIPGEEQCYSLIVTNSNGDRKYGYCRRVQPEDAPICLPLAYCIISPLRASGFFFKVLAELESRHGEPEIQQSEFIQRLYESNFPAPGHSLQIHGSREAVSVGCAGSSSSSGGSLATMGFGGNGAISLSRPDDPRLEERDLTRLFNSLQIPVFLKVFGSLLLERKIVLLSDSISKVSACVEALQSILFPFLWQHTLIPVLPTHMLEVCQAPTPYIIGVLKTERHVFSSISVDHGIVVDLDKSAVLQSQHDEMTILPPKVNRSLKTALELVQSSSSPTDPSRNMLVSETFLRLFVEICGHYQAYIVVQQDGKRIFERESFINAIRSSGTRMFLEWFTETAMFSAFIESRLEASEDAKGIFEQRLTEHQEERDKNTLLYLKNYKGLNRKVKTLGDRFKDWTPFS